MAKAWGSVIAGVGMLVAAAAPALGADVPRLVTQVVDERDTVALPGNTRPEAIAEFDRGPMEDSAPIEHLQLLLKRPEATQAALTRRIDALYDRSSPLYHRWLTAGQLGAEFGPAEADVAAVKDWLEGRGFRVNGVQTSRLLIDFSGTAAQVRLAFGTEIHRLDVQGQAHIANMSDPRVPAALAGVVAGIVSLHDFRPHANHKLRSAYTYSTEGLTYYAVVPADLATIYNLVPLFAAGISGQGQTIVVIEDTNVYSTNDWTSFRNAFGLSAYASGSFTQEHPSGSSACANPSVVPGNEIEAELDAEWASAAAPSAAIVLASCADTATDFGGLLALQNLLNGSEPPAIVSISYGECEAENGATANAAYYATFEQAAAQGTSVYVAAGDEGGAGCDPDASYAVHGLGVSGFASTPYNVAVGGTDFGDTYAGANSKYWSAANSSTYGSALSYINEIPWNDSCAGNLLAKFLGYAESYGTNGFCNSALGVEYYLSTAAGSGGRSGCATGAPAVGGVVGGTCKPYAKPAWQVVFGNPADKKRDLPDVSLFAANGLWGHYYVFCDSDLRDGGAPCSGAPSGWVGAGGTSFAAPIWAGFQALVNQAQGATQGNPNPVLYALAAAEYGASGNASCYSTLGLDVASSCVFYDVKEGSAVVNCRGTYDCYDPSGANGVLSAADTSDTVTYGTKAGWDFATGIGTVNVYNLVTNW